MGWTSADPPPSSNLPLLPRAAAAGGSCSGLSASNPGRAADLRHWTSRPHRPATAACRPTATCSGSGTRRPPESSTDLTPAPAETRSPSALQHGKHGHVIGTIACNVRFPRGELFAVGSAVGDDLLTIHRVRINYDLIKVVATGGDGGGPALILITDARRLSRWPPHEGRSLITPHRSPTRRGTPTSWIRAERPLRREPADARRSNREANWSPGPAAYRAGRPRRNEASR